MKQNIVVAALVSALMGGFVLAYLAVSPPATGRVDMGIEGPNPPPIKGFAEGEGILFLHTEASDPDIAETLTQMMGSPVLVVPSLAEAPDSMLANVYVFQNGIQGDGPLGFQPDVFDNPPGGQGYRPLRRINMASWTNEEEARVLKSVREVEEARNGGELAIEQSDAVVNMPMLTWPDGQR